MLKLYLWFSLKTVTNQRREPDPLGFKCICTTPEKQSKRVEPKARRPLSGPSLHAEGQLQLKVLIRAWHLLFGPNEPIPQHQHSQVQPCSMSHSRQKLRMQRTEDEGTQEKSYRSNYLLRYCKLGLVFRSVIQM